MNPNTNDPKSIKIMSDEATRASELAFGQQGLKPYDQEDELKEPEKNTNDDLLPKTKSDRQFLNELSVEVKQRDELIAKEAAKVVLEAEIAQVYDTTPPANPDIPQSDSIGNIRKIQEAAKDIPDQDVA